MYYFRFHFLYMISRLSSPLIAFALSLWFSAVLAQDARIAGVILDKSTKTAIRGVNVSIEGTFYGAVSDAEGKFTIRTSSEPPYTLVFERMPYVSQRRVVQERKAEVQVEMMNPTEAAAEKSQQEAVQAQEYNLKLLMLEKFSPMITWAAQDTAPVFTIAILGYNPFGDNILNMETKKLNGKPVQITFVSSLEDMGTPNMLYIAATKRNKKLFTEIAAQLKTKPILTVSDDKTMISEAMISFFQEEDNLRFTIDAAAAKKAGITISEKLTALSQ